MAKIPVYTSQGEIPGPQPNRSRTIQNQGAGLEQLGETLFKIGTVVEQNRRTTMVDSAVAQASLELRDFNEQLAEGRLAPDGTVQPPPDPTQHSALWEEQSKAVMTKWKKTLKDDVMYDLFSRKMANTLVTETLAMQKNALTMQKKFIGADLDTAMQAYVQNVTDAPDEVIRQQGISNVERMVAEAVQRRIYTPDEGNKKLMGFYKDVAVSDLRKAMRDDPDNTVIELLSSSPKYEHIPADEKQKWIDVAIQRSQQIATRKHQEAEWARQETERRARELQEQTAKAGWHLSKEGRLTTQWVDANFNLLSKEDYRLLMEDATGQKVHTNIAVYAPLRMKASRGMDVRYEAKAAYEAKDISRDDYDRILSEVEGGLGDDPMAKKSWYKAGANYLTRITGADQLNPPVGATDRAAMILDMWRDWGIAHPNATNEEAQKEYQALGKQAAMVERGNMLVSMIAPRYLVGSRTAPNLDETWRKTQQAYKNGQIGYQEFLRENTLINDWQQTLNRLHESESKTPLTPEPPVKQSGNAAKPKAATDPSGKKSTTRSGNTIDRSEKD